LSERKGEKVLNLQSLYRFVVQDIAKRERFWWRRIAFGFSLIQGQPTYDLTTVATTPATAMTEILLDEIAKFTIIVAPNPYLTAEMLAVFDPETLIDMIQNTQLTSPTAGNPNQPGGRYTMDAGDYKTIRIDPPDAAYNAFMVGWGMPNPAAIRLSTKYP
jgi:hypothetical protein